MKNFKKIAALVLAAVTAVSAMSVTAMAEMIPGFEYDEETQTAVYCEKDSSELPNFNARRYLPETSFSQKVRLYPESTKISVDIPLSSGEEYIYVEFDEKESYRIRLRNATSGSYVTDWSGTNSNDSQFYFHNFPTGVTYNIYLASTTVAKTMSGVIYTQ